MMSTAGLSLDGVTDRLRRALDGDELTGLVQQALRIPSHKEYPGEEREIAEFIARLLGSNGLQAELQTVQEDRANVLCRIGGRGEGPSLILNGHMDTIPPLDMGADAFSGRREGNLIYGRGAADMKGATVAMAYALVLLKRTGLEPPGDLIYAAVVGEEYESNGTQHLMQSGLRADWGIVGEPTDLQVAVAHKGIEWMQVAFEGRSVHSSVAHRGVNAVRAASEFVHTLYAELDPALAERVHPLAGRSLVNVGAIRGGRQPNVVPPDCVVEMERRWIPAEDLAGVYRELEHLAEKVAGSFGARAAVAPMAYSLRCRRVPLDTSPSSPIARAVQRAAEAATGGRVEIIGVPYWCDAAVMASAGVPSVVFGPGSISSAHSAAESIAVESLVAAALSYALIPFTIAGC